MKHKSDANDRASTKATPTPRLKPNAPPTAATILKAKVRVAAKK